MAARIYIPKARLAGDSVPLTSEELGYLVRVRRLRPGETLEVFDGEGGRYEAKLLPGSRALALGARESPLHPRRFGFELWQGLAKGDKLELVVQKATELGVARIVPFTSMRSVVKLSAERGVGRVARLRKIAEEAARQCGRADVPEISAPAALQDFFASWPTPAVKGVLYERETDRSLWPFLSTISTGARVALAVGPEGGFAPEEIEAARLAGVPTLDLTALGGLILRTETAAIAVCVMAALAAAVGEPGDA